MKKEGPSLMDIKQKIEALKGINIQMEVNRGRNKVYVFAGKITEVYPSVFTIAGEIKKKMTYKTFSYYDVVCGEVKIL